MSRFAIAEELLWQSVWVFGRVLRALFGSLSYETPAWLRFIGRKIAAAARWLIGHPKHVAASLAVLAVLSFAGWRGCKWYGRDPSRSRCRCASKPRRDAHRRERQARRAAHSLWCLGGPDRKSEKAGHHRHHAETRRARRLGVDERHHADLYARSRTGRSAKTSSSISPKSVCCARA